ncbi:MAG: hypothetical protein ACLFVO_25320 [Chloroflexaceae bacterium]
MIPRWRRRPVSDVPPLTVYADGSAPLRVATRFGILTLHRRVLAPTDGSGHLMPGNAVLPPHQGMIITRGLQEWACLLPQDLSFATASRRLGWQATAQADAILSDTTVRTLVRQHGQAVRQAEAAAATAVLARPDRDNLQPQLVPTATPRGRAAWPVALTAAVEAALADGAERPPTGVSSADWARVLACHAQDPRRTPAQVRTLGPQVPPDEVLVTVDEVCTRKTTTGFWELRTARVTTATGSRYVSGTGAAFLTVLLALVLLCAGRNRRLLVLADGAQWIRRWVGQLTDIWPHTCLLLDWYHLRKRCNAWGSMICRGRAAKREVLRPVLGHRWQDHVAEAIAGLEAYRPQARSTEWLEKLIRYLQEREPFIPDYHARRRHRQYIGSGQVEKANDQIVAQRQKGAGMRWSLATSDALAALRTLILNDEWDAYWCHRQMPSLVVA